MGIGNTITSATAGSVLFAGASGVLAQDNANFFWDDTNNRLGIGTASPGQKLDVTGNGQFTGTYPYVDLKPSGWANPFYFQSGVDVTADNGGDYTAFVNPTGKGFSFISPYSTSVMVVNSTGNVGIGTTSPAAKLEIGTGAAATKGMIVRAAASQTANLTEWQNSSGTVVASVSSLGNLSAFGTDPTLRLQGSSKYLSLRLDEAAPYAYPKFSTDADNFTFATSIQSLVFGGTYMTVNFGAGTSLNIDNIGQTTIYALTAASKVLTVKGAASQSANLQEWQNSAGTALTKVDSEGGITVNRDNTDYTNTAGAGSAILMTNPNAGGQNVIASYINGTLAGKWRSDSSGNQTWVAGANSGTAGHYFAIGGDYGTGLTKLKITNSAVEVTGGNSVLVQRELE